MRDILQVINNYEWGLLTQGGIYLRCHSREEAFLIGKLFFDNLAVTASKLKNTVNILVGSRKILQIDEYMYTGLREGTQMANELWFGADIGFHPNLIRLALEICERPRSAGIVRLSDERQVLMHDEATCTLKTATAQEATQWTREDYWHPQDLLEFRRICQQQENFEHSYRTFMPTRGMLDTEPGNWQEITTSYQLFEIEGVHYQLYETLGFRDIEAPTDLRI